VEQHRVNKCITAQITDFEQAILAQANDKWKPITLADGAFDLDELKKDISSADAKFSGRKYKLTALILEYLVSRASKQGIPAPTFATVKHTSGKSKRGAVEDGKRPQKRFQGSKPRQQYTMEQDLWEEDFEGMEKGADWNEDQEHEDEAAEDWDFYAFQQSSSGFSPCTTQYCKDKNIAHTHSTERCYKLHPSKGKGASPKGRNSLLFTKGHKGKDKNKGKGKGKQGKGKGNRKGFKGKSLGKRLDDTCHFCKQPGHYKAQCSKYAALSASTVVKLPTKRLISPIIRVPTKYGH
jgi:hypothetical protein